MADIRQVYPEELSLDLVKNWIHQCKTENHHLCELRNQPRVHKLRLIDCKRRMVIDAPPDCSYVALSYVWGNSNARLTQDYDSLGPWFLLPNTVRQCIELTLGLNYRYLWIDRYCIRQGNRAHQQTQIAQMGTIYASADLTIVAAAGKDPSYGLPGLAPTLRQHVKHEAVNGAHIYALPHISGLRDVRDSTWASRAWTFQEGFLSRRRLIFTDGQVIFVCNTLTHYEAKTAPFDGNDLANQGRIDLEEASLDDEKWLNGFLPPRRTQNSMDWTATDLLQQASGYLETFSMRSLTYEQDALDAIRGALNSLAPLHIYHIWGVPFQGHGAPSKAATPSSYQDIRYGDLALLWDFDGKGPHRRRTGFPSWSSIGWEGRIRRTSSNASTVDSTHIYVETDHKHQRFMGIMTYISFPGLKPLQCLQQLEIRSETAEFVVISHCTSPRGFFHPLMVALHFDANTNVPFDVTWDAELQEPIERVKGVLVRLADARPRGHTFVAILLRQCGSFYERAGLLRFGPLGYDFSYAGNLDGKPVKLVDPRPIRQLKYSRVWNDWILSKFKPETIYLR